MSAMRITPLQPAALDTGALNDVHKIPIRWLCGISCCHSGCVMLYFCPSLEPCRMLPSHASCSTCLPCAVTPHCTKLLLWAHNSLLPSAALSRCETGWPPCCVPGLGSCCSRCSRGLLGGWSIKVLPRQHLVCHIIKESIITHTPLQLLHSTHNRPPAGVKQSMHGHLLMPAVQWMLQVLACNSSSLLRQPLAYSSRVPKPSVTATHLITIA